MKTEKLEATTQKSYYGKAKINILDNGTKELISYKTKVAIITKGGRFFRLWEGYSLTTMNHINDFRRKYGLEPINASIWKKMEVVKNGNEKKWVFVLRDFKRNTTEVFNKEQKQNCMTRTLKKAGDNVYGDYRTLYLRIKQFIESPELNDSIKLENATLSFERR